MLRILPTNLLTASYQVKNACGDTDGGYRNTIPRFTFTTFAL
jgi:hypothetical protein